MTRRKLAPFATEVALCERFISAVGKDWTAYAETGGWDILLVRAADGFQVGIQAKLRLNADVINQAIDEYLWDVDKPGPDCRAVMVPRGSTGGFSRIADHLGLTVISVDGTRPNYVRGPVFWPALPGLGINDHTETHWHEHAPARRHKLPDYVPDVPAGARSPVQLTKWKIAAIKIAVTMEKRGFVTRADFKRHRIDHRRWLAPENKWLVVSDGRFTAGARFPNLKEQHPRVYAEILAEAAEWLDDVAEPRLLGV